MELQEIQSYYGVSKDDFLIACILFTLSLAFFCDWLIKRASWAKIVSICFLVFGFFALFESSLSHAKKSNDSKRAYKFFQYYQTPNTELEYHDGLVKIKRQIIVDGEEIGWDNTSWIKFEDFEALKELK